MERAVGKLTFHDQIFMSTSLLGFNMKFNCGLWHLVQVKWANGFLYLYIYLFFIFCWVRGGVVSGWGGVPWRTAEDCPRGTGNAWSRPCEVGTHALPTDQSTRRLALWEKWTGRTTSVKTFLWGKSWHWHLMLVRLLHLNAVKSWYLWHTGQCEILIPMAHSPGSLRAECSS
jgi:hypothetical protein